MTEKSAHQLGFSPVAASADALKPRTKSPKHQALDSLLPLPNTPLVQASIEYLKPLLPANVFNHSKRAYLFAIAIAKEQFPDWSYDAEGLYLALLWHDYGATPKNIRLTKMSFELWSAIKAREFLLERRASDDLADGVAETINRHTDFTAGSVTTHVQLIQLGTIFDNHGGRTELLNKETVDEIVQAYPRLGWNEGFAAAMEDEVNIKPWSHTTCFEGAIWAKSRANEFMAQYEKAEAA